MQSTCRCFAAAAAKCTAHLAMMHPLQHQCDHGSSCSNTSSQSWLVWQVPALMRHVVHGCKENAAKAACQHSQQQAAHALLPVR